MRMRSRLMNGKLPLSFNSIWMSHLSKDQIQHDREMYKFSKVGRGIIRSRPQSCLAVKKDAFIYFCLYLSVREEWEKIVLYVCVCVEVEERLWSGGVCLYRHVFSPLWGPNVLALMGFCESFDLVETCVGMCRHGII